MGEKRRVQPLSIALQIRKLNSSMLCKKDFRRTQGAYIRSCYTKFLKCTNTELQLTRRDSIPYVFSYYGVQQPQTCTYNHAYQHASEPGRKPPTLCTQQVVLKLVRKTAGANGRKEYK